MPTFLDDIYPFKLVDDNPEHFKYNFVSKGQKDITKRVSIRLCEFPDYNKYFYLEFGNITFNAQNEEKVCDMTRDNNKGDAGKVLKTVFACAFQYFSTFSDSILAFYGNTSAKHRLYKGLINKNLSELQTFFIIKGGIITDLELIETIEYGKEPKEVDPKDIIYQLYDPQHSMKYSFITFELKDEFK